MAAYVADTLLDSEFTTQDLSKIDRKYFDVYDTNSSYISFGEMILGDATGEMGPFSNYADDDSTERYHNSWYADHSFFVNPTYSWFSRGGVYNFGVLAGQFYFHGNPGSRDGSLGSRLVLAPAI